jgi:hypothetical protein
MPCRHSTASVFALVFAVGSTGAALDVRVDATGGVPRLMVDGLTVRARIFWGAPGTTPLSIGPEWRTVMFEFTATGNASNGTLHVRFGETPG